MALAFGFRPLPIKNYDKQEEEEARIEWKGGHCDWEHWGQEKKLYVWEWVLYALMNGTPGVLI